MSVADCLFCGIVSGTAPAKIVHRDEWVTAFRDIRPQAPVHVLIVTNKHIDGPLGIEPEDAELIGRVLLAAKAIAAQNGLEENGFRIVANEGRDAGQSVEHLHFHLLGGRAMKWPPG